MEANARRVLDIIDLQLEQSTLASQELWDVLTALRAPDGTLLRTQYKRSNTLHIRERAFPRTARIMEVDRAHLTRTRWQEAPEQPYTEPEPCPDDWHWARHTRAAAKVLGLK